MGLRREGGRLAVEETPSTLSVEHFVEQVGRGATDTSSSTTRDGWFLDRLCHGTFEVEREQGLGIDHLYLNVQIGSRSQASSAK